MPSNAKLVRKSILEASDTKSLAQFAGEVERRLAKAKNPESAANIVCRLMTSKDQRIAALMTCKWVEWRYGKPKENAESLRSLAINIINHIPRPGEIAQGEQIAPAIASEPNENGETKIIQAEPKSKQ